MSPMVALRSAALVVAQADGVPVGQVLHPGGFGRPAQRRRHLAAYLAHVALGVPKKRLASAFGITPRAVRQGLSHIEDQRDCPAADARISQLEDLLCAT